MPARGGQDLTADQRLWTERAASSAVMMYPDGTRVTLAGDTSITYASPGYKKVTLTEGVLTAEVAAQPAGKQMVIFTPHAEARVLGTEFTLEVTSKVTRLMVTKGAVRFSRLRPRRRSLRVRAGQQAWAGEGVKFAVQPFERIATGLQALYLFKEGKGRAVADTSGVGRPLSLIIQGKGFRWRSEGLEITDQSTLMVTPGPAAKIFKACRASDAITLEAWVTPITERQTWSTARIVALSSDTKNMHDFILGQEPSCYAIRL